MTVRLKAAASAIALFLVLSLALGSLHYALYRDFADEGQLNAVTEGVLLLLALAPAAVAGFLAGFMSRKHGVIIAAVSVAIAAIALYGVLGAENWSQQLVTIGIGALAGGCGQLLAGKYAA